jgi:hypothetical protein
VSRFFDLFFENQVTICFKSGETGTGKTSLLALLINVLAGRSPAEYDLQPYDLSNETGRTETQTHTNSARLYQFYSANGVKITVLDTPGFADTRGLQRDEQHKASIVDAIRYNFSEVTAVIIVANGIMPRLSFTTDYVISTLTSILPSSLAVSPSSLLVDYRLTLGFTNRIIFLFSSLIFRLPLPGSSTTLAFLSSSGMPNGFCSKIPSPCARNTWRSPSRTIVSFWKNWSRQLTKDIKPR